MPLLLLLNCSTPYITSTPPSVSSSCQSSTAPFSFQVTAHNCCEASGFPPVFQLVETWGQGSWGLGTGVCLCVSVWVCAHCVLFKSKCLPFVACSGILSVTPRPFPSRGTFAPSQRKSSFSMVIPLPEIPPHTHTYTHHEMTKFQYSRAF